MGAVSREHGAATDQNLAHAGHDARAVACLWNVHDLAALIEQACLHAGKQAAGGASLRAKRASLV